MAYERFVGGGRGYSPKVSVRRSGQLGLNRGCVHRWGLDKYESVVLFFDRESQVVGIRPTNDENEDGRIKLYVRPNNVFVAAKAFMDYFALDYGQSRSYVARWSDEEGMIVIDLTNPK